MGEGAGGSVVSGTGRDAGSCVPSKAGSPLDGVGVANRGSSCGFVSSRDNLSVLIFVACT